MAAVHPPDQADSAAAAQAAGLRYVTDDVPGITRVRRSRSFAYFSPGGMQIRDETELGRIRAIAVPPAYTDVWICPLANGHIQATARDKRGRKQYRYHKLFREVRDETKYGRMIAFAEALPNIRKRLKSDLARKGLSREKVLATVVELLETTGIRVGNEEYAKANNSFGLTTLRGRHARVKGATVRFSFRGKSGIRHAVDLRDGAIAKTVAQCQDLPGQRLFQYIDDGGTTRDVESSDVNGYIREVAGADFSAKDFRTWTATVECARLLAASPMLQTQGERKSRVTDAIGQVARSLRNTPAVCRKCYVHPQIVESYMGAGRLRVAPLVRAARGLSKDELLVLSILRERADRAAAARANTGNRSRFGDRNTAPIRSRPNTRKPLVPLRTRKP
jgi:DNA topoisomerase-1